MVQSPCVPTNDTGDDQTNPNANPIVKFTCYYYEYDADGRVSKEVVFGNSNESNFSNTPSTNDQGYNNWSRKSVETQLNGTTKTVYTNYAGEVLLSDLYDAHATPSTAHTITYNEYDDKGQLILSAAPSAVSGYTKDQNGNWDQTTPVTFTADGLVYETTYTAAGYVEYELLRKAESDPNPHYQSGVSLPLTDSNASVLIHYAYTSHTVNNQTVYYVASATNYLYADGHQTSGVGWITTNYAYSWYSGSFQIQEETMTQPPVAADQNGPGGTTGAVSKQWFDDHGKLAWSMDQLGHVTYTKYDPLTGKLNRIIQDIDSTYAASLSLSPPATWTLPSSGGANQVTDYQYDALGRVTETRTAQGYAEYNSSTGKWDAFTIVGPISIKKTDRDGRVTDQIQAAYSDTVAHLATATILQSDYTAWTHSIYKNTRLWATAVYYAIPSSTSDPDGDGFIGSATQNYTLTAYGYENFGVSTDKGRLNKTVAVTGITVANGVVTFHGTITRYVLDARGNVLETWMGTNDDNANDLYPQGVGPSDNNMVMVSSGSYDADGNLLSTTQYPGLSSNDVTTTYNYDYRDRRTDVLSPANVVTHYEYDNLGRNTEVLTYADIDSDYFITTGGHITDTNPESNELRAETQNHYDALGRVYESDVYEVDQQDAEYPGTVGDYLPTYYWYNAGGQVAKTANGNGLFQKYAYDGLGRLVNSYTSYDSAELLLTGTNAYNAALTVTGDTVIEQYQTWYDGAGEAVASATYQRLPGDTTLTGPLDGSNSYATASVMWYDGLGRVVESVDLGREDKLADATWTHNFFDGATGELKDTDSDGIPDVAESAPFAPDSSDDYIVSKTEYNPAGRPYQTIDNLGRINETIYDDAGRTVRTIQNYDGWEYGGTGSGFDQNGNVLENSTEQDITVDYQYDSAGRLATMTAYNAKGYGNGVDKQATAYLYDSTINGSWQTSTIYPDSVDGHNIVSLARGYDGLATADVPGHGFTSGQWVQISGTKDSEFNGRVQITVVDADHFTYSVASSAPDTPWGQFRVYNLQGDDKVSTAYDQLGRITGTTDQRGVEHIYSFDFAGRPSKDSVDLANVQTGQNVDNSVLCIGKTYDDVGRLKTVTEYSDTTGTSALNQVEYEYNGWGKLYREYQEHDGIFNTGTTQYVQYQYADYVVSGTNAAKYVRLEAMSFPNGRGIDYKYGTTGAIDDIMSRLATIEEWGPSATYSAYTYLGANKIVTEDYQDA
jgi:YD repeat-containing protein